MFSRRSRNWFAGLKDAIRQVALNFFYLHINNEEAIALSPDKIIEPHNYAQDVTFYAKMFHPGIVLPGDFQERYEAFSLQSKVNYTGV